MKFLSGLAFLLGIGGVLRLVLPASNDLGGAHQLMREPESPWRLALVNIVGSVALFVLSFVVWRIGEARELRRTR